MKRLLLLLLLLLVACEGPADGEDDPPAEPVALLSVTPPGELVVGVATPITATFTIDGEPDDDELLVTVAADSEVQATLAAGATAATAPPVDGAYSFDVSCSAVGPLTLLLTTSTDLEQEVVVPCVVVTVDVVLVDDCAFLMADGSSFCDVEVRVARDDGDGAQALVDEPLAVSVIDVEPVLSPLEPDPSMLRVADDPFDLHSEARVVTDADGLARFQLVSPAFDLQQVWTLRCEARGVDESVTRLLPDFEDRSALTLTVDPADGRVVSGEEVELEGQLTATDGRPGREGDEVSIATSPEVELRNREGRVLFAGVPTDARGVFYAAFTAPSVDSETSIEVTATYQASVFTGESSQTVTVVVSPAP